MRSSLRTCAGLVAAALAMTLASCSDQPSADPAPSSPQEKGASSPLSPGPAQPAQAVPGTKDSLQDELAGIAEMLGVKNPPDVDVVREILPEEYPDVALPCMKEQGFTLEVLEDGSLTSTYPTDQEDAYNLAQYVCMAKYPHYSVFYLPKSDTTLRVMYDWATDNILPCLAEEGVTVEDVPTFEVYRDRYRTEGATWNPLFDNPRSQCEDVPQQLVLDSAQQ